MELKLVPAVITALFLCVASAFMFWRRRHIPISRTAIVLLLIGAAWTLTRTAQLGSVDVESALFWWRMRYICVILLPPVWLVYTIQFTIDQKLPWRVMIPLGIVAAVSVVLVLTAGGRDLMWSNIRSGHAWVVERGQGNQDCWILGVNHLWLDSGPFRCMARIQDANR